MTVIFLAASLISSAVCDGPSGYAGVDVGNQPLFENGRSVWNVVVPSDAPCPIRYAAAELTNVLFRISGAHVGVISADAATGGRLAPIAAMPRRNIIRFEAPDAEPMRDEFSVMTTPGTIFLKGNSPRAALFAAYAFLRDRLGVRWYWPGESGEYLPSLDRFDVETWEKSYKPFFEQRALSICTVWRHRHADTERWFPKVFINCGGGTPEIQDEVGSIRRATGHYLSLPQNMKEREKVFAEHPEWFSLIGGKRDIKGYAGCWSNEGFFRYAVSNIVRMIRERRAVQANMYAADILPRCECAECTKNPDVSARWWDFYARVIDAVREEIPGMNFAGLAYQEYRAIPTTPVRNVDHVEYCHYNRCYYHLLGDKTCPRNVKSMEEFRSWGKMAPLGFYGYAFDAVSLKKPLYLPLWRIIGDEMRVFRKMGLKRVKTEYHVDLQNLTRKKGPLPRSSILLLNSRLSFYAWAMAAFDPDLDMDALVDDFCLHVYGAGAEEMKAYHNAMATAWGSMKSHLGYFFSSPRGPAMELITPEVEKEARMHLAAAKEKTKNDARAAAEIALDAEGFENWVCEAKEGRRKAVIHELEVASDGDPFAKAGWLAGMARRGVSQKTRFKIARGETAFHVLAECEEEDMASLNHGTERNDDPNIWGSGSYIEMFIETADGTRHQIAVSPAGGIWDTRNGDIKWNSGAKTEGVFAADRWTLKIAFPYEALGGTPKAGDRWKLMAIRNVSADPGETPKFASCGWPTAAHGDWGSAATLVFK